MTSAVERPRHLECLMSCQYKHTHSEALASGTHTQSVSAGPVPGHRCASLLPHSVHPLHDTSERPEEEEEEEEDMDVKR